MAQGREKRADEAGLADTRRTGEADGMTGLLRPCRIQQRLDRRIVGPRLDPGQSVRKPALAALAQLGQGAVDPGAGPRRQNRKADAAAAMPSAPDNRAVYQGH